MAPVVVHSFKDSASLAESFGKFVLSRETESLQSHGVFRVAVSGGSLGKVLKKALIANEELSDKIQWNKWQVFFSDERLVPLDHEDSNYKLFEDMVINELKKLGKPLPQVYTVDGKLISDNISAEDIAKDYEAKITESFGVRKSQGSQDIPEFDLVLLGCGPDGHTCSLFEAHPLLSVTDRLIAAIEDSPKPPPRRITFTLPLLKAAKSIAFVAEGGSKAPVLREIFAAKSEGNPLKYPSDIVNHIAANPVTWFVDYAAVEGVDLSGLKG